MGGNNELTRLMQMATKGVNVTINNQDLGSFTEMVVKRTSDGGTVVMIDSIPAFSDVEINIEVHGDVESLSLGSGTITCANVNNGIKTVSGDVICENVFGNITSTSGDIKCSDVAGNVSTVSGDVNCDDIGGNASTISGDIF